MNRTVVEPPPGRRSAREVHVDGELREAARDERLIDLLNRCGVHVPQVCYHPQLGPIQTCDTCLVEVDGALVRACATEARGGMVVATGSPAAKRAQHAAFDPILGNHPPYPPLSANT